MATIQSNRIPYHSDGSILRMKTTANGWHEMTHHAAAAMNTVGLATCLLNTSPDLKATPAIDSASEWQILFPVPTDINGIYASVSFGAGVQPSPDGNFHTGSSGDPDSYQLALPVKVLYSTDTMGGDDGIWQEWGTLQPSRVPYLKLGPKYLHSIYGVNYTNGMWPGAEEKYTIEQTQISTWFQNGYQNGWVDHSKFFNHLWESYENGGVQLVPLYSVRGLRFQAQPASVPPGYAVGTDGQFHYLNMFLYGGPADTVNDYLQVEDVTFGKAIDQHESSWGTVAQHSSDDKKIRVRNKSWERTATHVTITAQPDDHLPFYYDGMLLFSFDGINWDQELTLFNLGPNTASQMIYVRRVTGVEFPTGFGQVLISARVGKWV